MIIISVSVFHFLAVLALFTSVWALRLDVKGHVSSNDSETTAVSTWLQEAWALSQVLQSRFIGVYLWALSITAFELQRVEVLLDHTMHLAPFYCLVTFALLWTVVIIFFPRVDAIRTEDRLTPATFLRIQNHIGAYGAHKEISSIPLLFVRLF